MPATVHPGPASPGDGTHPDDLPYAQAWADAMVVTPTGWYVDAGLFRVRFAALREAALRESGMPVAGDEPVSPRRRRQNRNPWRNPCKDRPVPADSGNTADARVTAARKGPPR